MIKNKFFNKPIALATTGLRHLLINWFIIVTSSECFVFFGTTETLVGLASLNLDLSVLFHRIFQTDFIVFILISTLHGHALHVH